jgi:hypothetical protein
VTSIAAVQPLPVAAWIELQTQTSSTPTVKQRLAAIRHRFDWLVTGQIVSHNPAAAVRGPAHSARTGATPVLDASEARQLLDSIDVSTPIGLPMFRGLQHSLWPQPEEARDNAKDDTSEGDEDAGRVFEIRSDAVTIAFERAVARARKHYVDESKAIKQRPDGKLLTDPRFHSLRHFRFNHAGPCFPVGLCIESFALRRVAILLHIQMQKGLQAFTCNPLSSAIRQFGPPRSNHTLQNMRRGLNLDCCLIISTKI